MEAAGVATGAVAATRDDELGIAHLSYFCVPLFAAFPASYLATLQHRAVYPSGKAVFGQFPGNYQSSA
jgi:hypothetical protein